MSSDVPNVTAPTSHRDIRALRSTVPLFLFYSGLTFACFIATAEFSRYLGIAKPIPEAIVLFAGGFVVFRHMLRNGLRCCPKCGERFFVREDFFVSPFTRTCWNCGLRLDDPADRARLRWIWLGNALLFLTFLTILARGIHHTYFQSPQFRSAGSSSARIEG